MAFQSVVVNSAVDLKTAIETFAQSNGWTLSGGVLSKNGCYTMLTVPSTSELRIQNAKNGDFTGVNIAIRYSRIYNTVWPSSATVYMVAFSNPDIVWITMNFDVVKFMHLGFGNIVKYGTWNGGQWFHAQHSSRVADGNVCSLIDGYQNPYFPSSAGECALFWNTISRDSFNGYNVENNASSIECDIRGYIWEPKAGTNGDTDTVWCPRMISPIHMKNPNVFNSQTLLTPFQLWLKASDGYMQCLGHIDHVRFVKLTNYNPGDRITLGSEQWTLYPWYIHDVSNPDGRQPNYHDGTSSTGVLGVAVKYDGP